MNRFASLFVAPLAASMVAFATAEAQAQTARPANTKNEAYIVEQVFSVRASDLAQAAPRPSLSSRLASTFEAPASSGRARFKSAPEFVDAPRSSVSEPLQPATRPFASVDIQFNTAGTCVRMDAIVSSPACPGAKPYEIVNFFRGQDAKPEYFGMICPAGGARDVEVRLLEHSSAKGCISSVFIFVPSSPP